MCGPLTNTVRILGEVLDVSLTGVQLRLPVGFDPEATLRMEIFDPQGVAMPTRCVKVRWAKKISERDWFFGCAFEAELSDGELSRLLGNAGNTVVV